MCPFTNRLSVKRVKASCSCPLMWKLEHMWEFSHDGFELTFCRVGWKERLKVTSVYAQELCSLVKLISSLLLLCMMAMVLECIQVCLGSLWSALLLFIHQFSTPFTEKKKGSNIYHFYCCQQKWSTYIWCEYFHIEKCVLLHRSLSFSSFLSAVWSCSWQRHPGFKSPFQMFLLLGQR